MPKQKTKQEKLTWVSMDEALAHVMRAENCDRDEAYRKLTEAHRSGAVRTRYVSPAPKRAQ